MKKTKLLLSLLLALALMLVSMVVLSSCDDTDDTTPPTTDSSKEPSTDNSTDSSNNTSDSSNNTTDSSDNGNNNQDVQKSSYTIKIYDRNTGKPIPDVSVYLQDEESYTAIAYARGKTDANGIVTLSAEPKYAKYVYVENFPKGYVYNDFYELGATGQEIAVYTEVIPSTGSLASKDLSLGNIMYDFSLDTFRYDTETGEFISEKITLSELFKNGKKAVMLNFWYTTCTYCIEEFPYIQSAYEQYGDELEIIAINAYTADSESSIKSFLNSFADGGYYTDESCPLTFPVAVDSLGIQDGFGFTVNPCSVIIDRYGMISMVQVGGVLGERYFTNAFEHYTSTDYEQELYASIYDLSPMIKPDVEMSDEADIKDAVLSDDINISFFPETDEEDSEYAWPFIVYEKDGKTCLASTNVDIDNSYAILYTEVELKAGQALMFDYFASTQRLYDVLHVIVNDNPIYSISGRPLENDEGDYLEDPWQACCPWVALEDGVYTIAFCYVKDESEREGDDRVYLDNFRVVNSEDIDVETYLPRPAATDMQDDLTFGSYVDIVLNEEDGYYHVGTVDGPLLLAGLTGVNTQFYSKLPPEENSSVTIKLTSDGDFIMNGKSVYNAFILYCQYATNSSLYGYCPVTPELRSYLEEFVVQNDFITDENTWLQLCSYYDAYGTDSELEDPIKGLSTFSAFDTVVTPEGEAGFLNTVTYSQIIMPRGYLFKFVPEKAGVYRIVSKSSQEVDGWVFTGNFDQWVNENGGDRILYTDSSIGERYCPELLVDTNGDGQLERDFTNCSMIAYFEEGVEYYIDIAYYDVYAAGTFTFDVKYVGESFDVFEEASSGLFTYVENIGDIIATGIEVELCTDEEDPRYGYYCHRLPNGTLGSIVYADFYYTTNIFSTQSILTLIEIGGFDMRMTDVDREAYVYFKNYYEKDGVSALEELWGDDFDAMWEYYQMDDIIDGIYHGKGPDYTEAMRAYLDKIDDGKDGGDEYVYPERQGCVPVDAELAVMLQALMDKFSFANVDHSWTKLCYYYKTLEAPLSLEEKIAELDAMVNSAEIQSAEIQAEIDALALSAKTEIEKWSIISKQRSIIDEAMTQIYALIKADASQQQ